LNQEIIVYYFLFIQYIDLIRNPGEVDFVSKTRQKAYVKKTNITILISFWPRS